MEGKCILLVPLTRPVAMGNSPLAGCSRVITCDPEYELNDEHRSSMRPSEAAADPATPQLALRIAYAPIEDSLGSRKSPFSMGDEVAIVKLQKVPGWEPMSWRQDRAAKQQATVSPANKIWPQPEESRFGRAQRFWAAKVKSSDGNGGYEDHWCLLQVGLTKENRDMEQVKQVIQDASDIASYAHRFNSHTARAVGEDPSQVPCVKVASPVACFVIDSASPEVAGAGEAVALTLFPANSITKFVFEGAEDFLELPQAFFHFVSWTSGGKEMVADLQGVQDDHDILLIDPVLIRQPEMGIGDLVNLITEQDGSSVPEKRFNVWHPRCAQLCRSFDPQRRSAQCGRRACGVALPTCGVGGA